jgi:O-antigen ligase
MILILYAFSLTSLLWSPVPAGAWFFLKAQAPYALLWFILAPLLISRLEDLDTAIRSFLVVGSLVAVFYLINPGNTWVGGRLVIDLGYQVGVGEIGSNPLALGDMGGMMAICAALYRTRDREPTMKVIQLVAFGLGLFCAVASGSRGQVLSGVAISAAFFPLLKAQRSLGTYFATVIALAIFAGITYSLISFAGGGIGAGPGAESRWQSGEVTTALNDRIGLAAGVIGAYTGSPAFWLQGLGAGAFNQFYQDPTAKMPYAYPHNIFVEALAELGLFGLILLMAICFYTASRWFALFKLTGVDKHSRSLSTVLLGLIVFQFLMSLKQGTLWGYPQLFMFSLILCKLALREETELENGGALHSPSQDEIDEYELAALQAEYSQSGSRAES